MKKVDFQTQVLKLLSGINQVVSSGMQGKSPFQIFKRPTTKKAGGKIVYRYYVQFLDERTGKYKTAVSSHQTSRAAAFQWALAQLSEEQKPAELTWKTFCQDIFEPDSEFFRHHELRGKTIGEVHRQHHQMHLRKYILPYFGNLKLAKTSSDDIEGFQTWLVKQPIGPTTTQSKETGKKKTVRYLSASSALKVINTFRLLVKWAMKKKHLKVDPFGAVDLIIAQRRRRGVLTMEEIKKLFSPDSTAWTDTRLRVLTLVAATSGLRAGELQGLQRSAVKEIQDPAGRPAGLLVVEKSWCRTGILKAPKNGKPRTSVIPHRVYKELKALMEESPYKEPSDFVFYQAKRNLPVSHQMIHEHFVKALAAIGIDEVQRVERNLVFHGLRHFANSHFVGSGVPVLKLQAMLGHNSDSMTMNYLHVGEDFSDVLKAAENIF